MKIHLLFTRCCENHFCFNSLPFRTCISARNAGGLFWFLAIPPDFAGLRLFLRIFSWQRNLSEILKGEMPMTIFETVKTTVAPRMAAEHFGLSVSRNGMACCHFHDDRHPSMELYENHYANLLSCSSHKQLLNWFINFGTWLLSVNISIWIFSGYFSAHPLTN